jgi:hypothetical protein
MSYIVEVSFNIYKNSDVTSIQEFIKTTAQSHHCSHCYHDYEFETNINYQRNHGVTTIIFSMNNINDFLDFLKNIKKQKQLYIETIYNEETYLLLYASKYYLTQKMDKSCAKVFIQEKRKRSYSEDETMILKIV